jgi:hypothetical protein
VPVQPGSPRIPRHMSGEPPTHDNDEADSGQVPAAQPLSVQGAERDVPPPGVRSPEAHEQPPIGEVVPPGQPPPEVRSETAVGPQLPAIVGAAPPKIGAALTVGQLSGQPAEGSKKTPSSAMSFDWGTRPITLLVVLHVVVVVAFAAAYGCAIKRVAPGIDAAVFVSATVAWFAFCGLLSTILVKVTLSLLAEARLTQSRRYIGERIEVLLALGVERETLVRLVEHGVFHESGSDSLDAKGFAPAIHSLKVAKEMIETLASKKE